ncbi:MULTISPECIES: SMC-Scp complex subunit ScpB [unclassified Gemella]|uniref:SMC-Scp complex subunit ScpB n=1 Tax=unclassified Gemella TaxID=2624949 RepID=UPI001C03DEE7|nr:MULTISPECIES: SMC-Scp complex subunit ScpB [unclassified Gemella]MBU0278346.1 SMC-Scp complex subunit ScpB [Gemella sp. zg-1178]QWQ38153.1 SMC-Scp complex subunit ScpB [Gemella sp. zg-570]
MLLDNTKEILEGLFFIKGDEGISIEYYSIFSDITLNEAENILNIFLNEYNKNSKVFVIKKFGGVYKMLVKDNIYKFIKEKLSSKNLVKLSKAALETLAIIAYNQPISKAQIDEIRGVNSDSMLYNLLEKELIFSNKTLDKIGKPKLYETTDLFLDIFGLEKIEELPKI